MKKTIMPFLLLGLTASCGAFIMGIGSNSRTITAPIQSLAALQERNYSEEDFDDEMQVDSEELGVSLTQSNTTDTSQSLSFAFKSKTLVAFSTARKNYVVNITDINFTGDYRNPVSEDYENRDEATGLPILEGSVVFVIGGGSNKDVYLPATLTRDGTFIIKVTTIATGAVTVNGAEYSGKNAWFDPISGLSRVTGIHIPDTVETIQAGAFTGVPESGVTITYEGSEIPEGWEEGWTDMDLSKLVLNSYEKPNFKAANVGGDPVTDIQDVHGRPVNFVLGSKQDGVNYIGEEYDLPMVIQFDKVKTVGDVETRETVFDELPLINTTNTAYDSVGRISDLSYSRTLNYRLDDGEHIDDQSIIIHNIRKFATGIAIDTSKRYFAVPKIDYKEKLDLSRLLTFEATGNSTFAGFSMFTFKMDRNLNIVSEKYPEPHSLYLDVKEDFYLQNKSKIDSGMTVIRYSLYNLYKSSYRFIYEGSDGTLKDVTVPISSVISYQNLNNDKNNKVSVIVNNDDVAPDFSAEKVRTFEMVDVTVQLDLFATSDTGSKTVLAKSQVQYKFAYLTIRSDEKLDVFNWNIFLIIFIAGFIAAFAGFSFALYMFAKEKFKNDEFRRVNDKKFLKQSLFYGSGSTVIVAAILFIYMRTVGFANTIVAFNPTDPLLIAFSIAGMIIGGYFIVAAIKAVKAENERIRIIRLKLNEDVDNDGTN